MPARNVQQIHAMALQFQRQGKPQQALNAWKECLRRQPNFTPAALGLARILYRNHQTTDARQVLTHCLRYGGESAELLHMLAALQHLARKFHEADRHLRRALALAPNASATLTLFGANLIELGAFSDAIQALKQALNEAPDNVDAHNNLAWAYRAQGDSDLAREHFLSAYRRDPQAIDALCGWLLVTDHQRPNTELRNAEKLLKEGKLQSQQKMALHFALGKAKEDQQEYDAAFAHFAAGSELWQHNHHYSIAQDRALFSTLNHAQIPQRRQQGEACRVTPVFIVGMPRSGTSLVEQIIAGHSACAGGGELPFWEQQMLDGHGKLRWPELDSNATRRAYQSLLESLAETPEQRYVTDKMPLNFRFIGAIKSIFPEAKIIHCRRDPRDTCLSLYKHLFPAQAHPYSYSFNDLEEFYHLYESQMRHWHTRFEGEIFDLQYETLIEHFDDQIHQLFLYLGLEPEAACRQFHLLQRPVRTASSEQVRQALYRHRVGHWQHYAEHLAPLLTAFGRD